MLELEQQEFGVGHPELGALILSLWGLPQDVVQSIACHHMQDLDSVANVSLTTRAVCAAERMLQSQSQPDAAALTGADAPAGGSATIDGPVQWQPLMDKLVEQGLIHSRNSADNLIG